MTTVSNLRDNLLVTTGMRVAYMDHLGLINIPRGVVGEDDIARFAVDVISKYPVLEVNFDEYIEEAILNKYGVSR